jgi:NADH:ubiquinone oxidoreductase subunit H
LLSVTFIILPVILAIAFVTLSDRKGIGILQRRLGPDTVGALGILQPFADALKLLIKEELQPSNSLPALGVTLPCLVLMCGLLGFTFIPVAGCQAELDVFFQILANIALLSLAVHGILYIA